MLQSKHLPLAHRMMTDLPTFDRYQKAHWSMQPGIELLLNFTIPTVQERHSYVQQYRVQQAMETLKTMPDETWCYQPEAVTLAYFLLYMSPTLNKHNFQETYLFVNQKHPVLPSASRLAMSPDMLQMTKKNKTNWDSIVPNDNLIKSFTYQFKDDWITISSTPPPFSGKKRGDLKELFLQDVQKTLDDQRDVHQTVAFLYEKTSKRNLDSEIASDGLYSAWVYWMLQYGTPQSIQLARMTAWSDTQDEGVFTKKSLLQAVYLTAIQPDLMRCGSSLCVDDVLQGIP